MPDPDASAWAACNQAAGVLSGFLHDFFVGLDATVGFPPELKAEFYRRAEGFTRDLKMAVFDPMRAQSRPPDEVAHLLYPEPPVEGVRTVPAVRPEPGSLPGVGWPPDTFGTEEDLEY